MKRDRFTFYRSFYEAIRTIPEADRLQMYDAIICYALDGVEPQFNGLYKTIWTLIKPVLEANWKRSDNARKGGAPKGNQNARKQAKTSKINQKQADIDNTDIPDILDNTDIPDILDNKKKDFSINAEEQIKKIMKQ